MGFLNKIGLDIAYKFAKWSARLVGDNSKLSGWRKDTLLLVLNRTVAVFEVYRDQNPDDEAQVKQALRKVFISDELNRLEAEGIAALTGKIKNANLKMAATHALINAQNIVRLLGDENLNDEEQIKAYLGTYWNSAESTEDIMLAVDGLLTRLRAKNPMMAEIGDDLIRSLIEASKA